MAAPAASLSVAPAPETGANAPMTVEQFLRLKESGFYAPHRAELRRGQVILDMPTSTLHIKALAKVLAALGVYRSEDRFLASQSTVRLGPHEAPEPDAFVVRGNVDDLDEEITPDRILLAVEVSVSTLKGDRTEKAAVYAEAGIPEYWIVNPVGRQVEIRREPIHGEYRLLTIVSDPGEITPLFESSISVSTDALIPKTKPTIDGI